MKPTLQELKEMSYQERLEDLQIQSLFRVRDSLVQLAKYGFPDMNLYNKVNEIIDERVNKQHINGGGGLS